MEEKTESRGNISVVLAAVCGAVLAVLVVISMGLGQTTSGAEKSSDLPSAEDLGLSVQVQEVQGSEVANATIEVFDELGDFAEVSVTLIEPDSVASEGAAADASTTSKTPFYKTSQYGRLVAVLVDYWSGTDCLVGFDVEDNAVVLFLGLPEGKNFIKKLDANDPRTVSRWNQVVDTIATHSKAIQNTVNNCGYSEVGACVIMLEALNPEKAAQEIEAGTFKCENMVLSCKNGKVQYSYR